MDDLSSAGVEPVRTAVEQVILTCIGVRDETPTIKTFMFHASAPHGTTHVAGQAVTLALPVDGEILYRTFTISSAPRTDGTLELTVKAHPKGRATEWLHRTIRLGSKVQSNSPRGRFTLARRSGHRLAFVSGGSGATPMMAMLRHLASVEPEVDVAWLHAAQSPNEVLFATELARLQETMPNLAVAVTVSRPAPGWLGFRGRLSRRLVSVAVPDLARREVFCCGPAGFMDEMRLIHAAEGGRKDSFHTEAFGGPPALSAQAAIASPADDAPSAASYEMRIADRILQVRTDESILQAALRQGVIIPCGCGQGMCGTCRVMKVSGDVAMNHQGGLAQEEERSGYILACSTKLLSDAEIRL